MLLAFGGKGGPTAAVAAVAATAAAALEGCGSRRSAAWAASTPSALSWLRAAAPQRNCTAGPLLALCLSSSPSSSSPLESFDEEDEEDEDEDPEPRLRFFEDSLESFDDLFPFPLPPLLPRFEDFLLLRSFFESFFFFFDELCFFSFLFLWCFFEASLPIRLSLCSVPKARSSSSI